MFDDERVRHLLLGMWLGAMSIIGLALVAWAIFVSSEAWTAPNGQMVLRAATWSGVALAWTILLLSSLYAVFFPKKTSHPYSYDDLVVHG